MAKERKSPQEKKHLELTRDHFTYGRQSSRNFPATWKRKKAHANREFRRKTDELLVQVKPGMAAEDASLIAEDVTVARLQKSVVRKRLQKSGTVTVGEKVKAKLERREELVGRRVRRRTEEDKDAEQAIRTLTSLEGEKLASFVRHAVAWNPDARQRAMRSTDPIVHAMQFLFRYQSGSNSPRDVICRNPEFRAAFDAFAERANRILARDRRSIARKDSEKRQVGNKVNTLRRASLG
jgi:hypothetical protein